MNRCHQVSPAERRANRVTTSHRAPADPANSAIGFYNAAWLVVAQGGWWTTQEIVDHIPLQICTAEASTLLWCMANRHHMLVARGSRKSRQYGITATCGAPKRLLMGELVEAITGRPFQGVTT